MGLYKAKHEDGTPKRDIWHGEGIFSRERKRGSGGRTYYVQYRYQGKRHTEKAGATIAQAGALPAVRGRG